MFQNIKFSEQRGITGNHFFDYASCITRLWIADRGLFAGTENEHINIGKFIDETSKPRLRKSLIIQGLCSIDYIEENDIVEVHEIKKGKIHHSRTFCNCYFIWKLYMNLPELNPSAYFIFHNQRM